MSPYLFSNNTELASPSQYKLIRILRAPNKNNYQTTTARRKCASGAHFDSVSKFVTAFSRATETRRHSEPKAYKSIGL